ncbi:MAG: hypothetical protein KIS66_13720 [Fimbriimonadaceae bacterium]|nr:hypothetical protein [Fimbriimonadaceae bacterium]
MRLNGLIDCDALEEPRDARYRGLVGRGWELLACHAASVILASVAAAEGLWWFVAAILVGGTGLIANHLFEINLWAKLWCLVSELGDDVEDGRESAPTVAGAWPDRLVVEPIRFGHDAEDSI